MQSSGMHAVPVERPLWPAMLRIVNDSETWVVWQNLCKKTCLQFCRSVYLNHSIEFCVKFLAVIDIQFFNQNWATELPRSHRCCC